MFPNMLTPGCFYTTNRPGLKVKYLGNNQGISLETGKKVKVTRGIVNAQLVVYDYARGLAEACGCRAELRPNGGIYITGMENNLLKVSRVITKEHRFCPPICFGTYVDGAPVDPPGTYPRVEIHPSMVVRKDA